MEDSDVHNLRTETLHQQYELVKRRTAYENSIYGSHIMQYGDVGLSTSMRWYSCWPLEFFAQGFQCMISGERVLLKANL